jgi:hypothetical protein
MGLGTGLVHWSWWEKMRIVEKFWKVIIML